MREVALALHDGLPSRGVASQVVCLAEHGATLDRTLAPSPGATSGGAFARLRGAARLLGVLVSRWRADAPDVVVAHAVMTAVLALTAARLAGVRRRTVVIHMLAETLGRPKQVALWLGCRTGVITDVVHCGQTVRDSFAHLGAAVASRSTVIQNGIRLPDAAGIDGLTQERPRFICAARLVALKNVDTLVRAAARLQVPATVVVCGDGEEEADLRALASELDAPVEFRGMVDRDELARLYAAATAFVLPSRLEGLPLVLIEAAAQGLPVVASDKPFNREIMGDAALYVDCDDVAGWARALDRLAGSPELRAQLVRGGLERASLFTLDRMVDAYATLFGADDVRAGASPAREAS
nr:glycosyltransferase family 4 protein [Propioniciclava soli]